jgi:hypothetical protein
MNAETTEVTTPTTGFTLLPPTNGQPTSAIPIAWCVSEEIQHFLAQRGVDDAFVLVVVTHGNREVSRYVFPIEHQQGFVHFRRSGEHTVHATIVWGWSRRSAHRQLLDMRSRRGSYSNDVTEIAFPPELEALRARRKELQTVLERVLAGQPEEGPSDADKVRSRIEALEGELARLQARLSYLEAGEPEPAPAEPEDTAEAPETPAPEEVVEDAEQIVRSARAQELNDEIRAIKDRIREIEEGEHPLKLRESIVVSRIPAQDVVVVPVPTGVFGKPSLAPVRWLARRNQWYWIDSPANPCVTRRRALINFFTMLVWIPFQLVKEVVLIVINALGLLGGFRGLQWRPLLKPWNYGFLVSVDSMQASWFTHRRVEGTDKADNRFEVREPIWFALHPALILFVACGYGLIHWLGWQTVAQTFLAAAVAGVLVALIMSVLPSQTLSPEELQRQHDKEQRRTDARAAAHRSALERRYAALSCPTDPEDLLRPRSLGVVWETFKIRAFACLPLAEDD